MDRSEVLRSFAGEILNFNGQAMVEEFIACHDLERAAYVILGGLDRCVEDKDIDPERAREMYAQLGISPDEVVRLRSGTDARLQ